MADGETRMALRAQRITGMAHLTVGYTLGRIAVRIVDGFIGDPATSRVDDVVQLGGAAAAGWQAVKGGKHRNMYAGAALAAASPILDSIADRAVSLVQGFTGGAAAGGNGNGG